MISNFQILSTVTKTEAIYKKVRWSNEFSDTIKFFTPTYQ